MGHGELGGPVEGTVACLVLEALLDERRGWMGEDFRGRPEKSSLAELNAYCSDSYDK